jgi:ferredoxin/coenzyme F420-reducing hydrogenase delta subunit
MPSLPRIDAFISGQLGRVFAAASNPWRHLGALAFLALLVTVVSGIVAYALYDTSIHGAYQSGLRLQNDPSGMGALLRGLHRHGADAFIVLTLLHLVREFLRGHYRHARWFSWVSGVPLMWLAWIAGLTGFWLLWDARALFSVTATAEWMQAWPLIGDMVARNFASAEAMNDRFFSLIMFMHIGVPLFLLGALWAHLARIRLPRLWPSRAATVVCLVLLAALSFAAPATSVGLADAAYVPARLSIDWFFLFPHALVEASSAAAVWLAAVAATLVLIALPWTSVKRAAPAAVVDLGNCNGCSRCVADCPFDAITMGPRTDARRHPRQAVVDADLCTSCGICVGACPSATPFRRIEHFVSGIELPKLPVAALKSALRNGLEHARNDRTVVAFCCRPARADLPAEGIVAIPLECAAMLPPSFVEYALRQKIAGVIVSGCAECDCEFRLGERLTVERFAGQREPHLRAVVPRQRIVTLWGGDRRAIEAAANRLRALADAAIFQGAPT